MPTVILWLAQGAVAFLGGRALSALLNISDLRDVEKFIREVIAALEQFISVEVKKDLSDMQIKTLIGGTTAILNDLQQFSAASEHEMHHGYQMFNLLENATEKTNEFVEVSYGLFIDSVFVFCNAVSLRLLSLACMYKTYGGRATLLQ